MLKESVQSALNDQVKQEFYSAHVYLSMCAWFEDQGLPGFAKWMRFQYQEELGHGTKIFDFINDRDNRKVGTLNLVRPDCVFEIILSIGGDRDQLRDIN